MSGPLGSAMNDPCMPFMDMANMWMQMWYGPFLGSPATQAAIAPEPAASQPPMIIPERAEAVDQTLVTNIVNRLVQERINQLPDTEAHLSAAQADFVCEIDKLKSRIAALSTDIENAKRDMAQQPPTTFPISLPPSLDRREVSAIAEQVVQDNLRQLPDTENHLATMRADVQVEINKLKEKIASLSAEIEQAKKEQAAAPTPSNDDSGIALEALKTLVQTNVDSLSQKLSQNESKQNLELMNLERKTNDLRRSIDNRLNVQDALQEKLKQDYAEIQGIFARLDKAHDTLKKEMEQVTARTNERERTINQLANGQDSIRSAQKQVEVSLIALFTEKEEALNAKMADMQRSFEGSVQGSVTPAWVEEKIGERIAQLPKPEVAPQAEIDPKLIDDRFDALRRQITKDLERFKEVLSDQQSTDRVTTRQAIDQVETKLTETSSRLEQDLGSLRVLLSNVPPSKEWVETRIKDSLSQLPKPEMPTAPSFDPAVVDERIDAFRKQIFKDMDDLRATVAAQQAESRAVNQQNLEMFEARLTEASRKIEQEQRTLNEALARLAQQESKVAINPLSDDQSAALASLKSFEAKLASLQSSVEQGQQAFKENLTTLVQSALDAVAKQSEAQESLSTQLEGIQGRLTAASNQNEEWLTKFNQEIAQVRQLTAQKPSDGVDEARIMMAVTEKLTELRALIDRERSINLQTLTKLARDEANAAVEKVAVNATARPSVALTNDSISSRFQSMEEALAEIAGAQFQIVSEVEEALAALLRRNSLRLGDFSKPVQERLKVRLTNQYMPTGILTE